MTSTLKRELRLVSADELVVGDFIVNVGTIRALGQTGVFVCALVRASEWNTRTGSGDSLLVGSVFHQGDNILIEREAK